jgi:hypothetical protein
MTYEGAVLVTSRNALAVTGLSWRRVRALAPELGGAVIRVSPRRVAVPAQPLLVALASASGAASARPVDPWHDVLVAAGVRER